MIPPEDAQQIAKGQQFISGVYYDPVTHQSTVELYTPVYSTMVKRILGVGRDTLNINSVWQIVNSEKGVHDTSSYPFILDQNGVRIADTNPKPLFTSLVPLDATIPPHSYDE